MNLRELRELAENVEAAVERRNANWSNTNYQALNQANHDFHAAANPETIKALYGLVDSLHAALRETMEMVEYGPLNAADRALALFDSFGSVPPETETP